MTSTFELTSTHVIAAGEAATKHAARGVFWRWLAERDPDLASADSGWLVSSFELVQSWPNWQAPSRRRDRARSFRPVHPAPAALEGAEAVRLSRGKTVLIPGHLARRPYQAPGPSSCVSPVPPARLLSPPKTFTSNAVSIQREAL